MTAQQIRPTLSQFDVHLATMFDDEETLAGVKRVCDCFMYSTTGILNEEQCRRLEACEHFFPNPPERRAGRTTKNSMKTIRTEITRLITTYPTLKSNDPELLTMKVELANATLRARFTP
jgi:hypothetical protein